MKYDVAELIHVMIIKYLIATLMKGVYKVI